MPWGHTQFNTSSTEERWCALWPAVNSLGSYSGAQEELLPPHPSTPQASLPVVQLFNLGVKLKCDTLLAQEATDGDAVCLCRRNIPPTNS